jgi:hypothetical protein
MVNYETGSSLRRRCSSARLVAHDRMEMPRLVSWTRPRELGTLDCMDIGVASRAVLQESSATEESVRIAREDFDVLKRIQLFESRWAQRHPFYARLLDWPVCGPVLRQRRERYVERMFRISVK